MFLARKDMTILFATDILLSLQSAILLPSEENKLLRANQSNRVAERGIIMVQVTHSVIFHCSPATLFAAVTDFSNEPAWQPAVIEGYALTEGPLRVGTQTYQKRIFMGKPVESTCEITVFEQDRKMVCRNDEVQTTYNLEPINDGTQFTFTIELMGKGVIWFLMQPLIKAMLRKDVVTRFQTLKGQLEANKQVAV